MILFQIMWLREDPFELLALNGSIHSLDPRIWTEKPNSNRKTISIKGREIWVKHFSLHLIMGYLPYSIALLQNWPLVIRGIKMSDNGTFKCQTSSHPPQYIIKTLHAIGNENEMHADEISHFLCLFVFQTPKH